MADGPVAPTSLAERFAQRVRRVDWMLMFPVAAALAWSFGQDAVAMVLVIVLPLCLALNGHVRRSKDVEDTLDAVAGRPLHRGAIQRILDDVLDDCARRERTTAVLIMQVDDLHIADGEWGAEIGEKVMDRIVQRVGATMRGQDAVLRAGDDTLVVLMAPTRRADLDVVMNIVDRLQAAVAEPISIQGRSIRVRSCIGICTESMAPTRSASALLAAADCALRIARRQGDDAVRVFNPDMQSRVEIDHRLSTQIEDALEKGEIRPWFQPQVDARTGRLAGFEALARWHHPELGILSPAKFLDTVASAGFSGEMGQHMLRASLEALAEWDRAGLDVPNVGVNVSLDELTDPRLAERVIWQLDRHEIEPSRIAFEILETVTLRDDDEAIMRNITALRQAGCRLDLDDFGTGAASIAHIARFGVHRIKIDRSFVSGLDSDEKQKDIVSAILSLADQLGIETLAEGVETPEERATLSHLGCTHLQGFGIARPMPFEDTIAWAHALPGGDAESLRTMQPHGTA